MNDNPTTFGLVLDCQDPAQLAEFWAAALDYVNVGRAGAYVVLLPNGRPGPKLLLQQVPEPKTVKNRMHPDIDAIDIEVESARLEILGARRVVTDPIREHNTSWILMADPEGNEGMSHAGTSESSADSITVEAGKTGELTHTFTGSASILIGCHEPGHRAAGMKATIKIG